MTTQAALSPDYRFRLQANSIARDMVVTMLFVNGVTVSISNADLLWRRYFPVLPFPSHSEWEETFRSHLLEVVETNLATALSRAEALGDSDYHLMEKIQEPLRNIQTSLEKLKQLKQEILRGVV